MIHRPIGNRSAQGKPACRLSPLAAAVALCFSATVPAANITVNTGNLTHGFGNCTLLDAVNSINQGNLIAGTGCSSTGTFGLDDTIVLKNFVFSFSDQAAGGNVTGNTAITLTKPVTLTGDLDASGKPLATIQRVNSAPAFRLIETDSSLTISGVTLQNGDADTGNGGGLYVTGHDPVYVSNSTISGNFAGDSGGGIYSLAALMITDSTINSNTAQASNGGGIMSTYGTLTIDNSTISGNTAAHGQGGGIFDDNGTVALTNTTVYGNYAQRGGGGEYANATTLNFCTITGNTTQFGSPGGGILVKTYSTATASLMYANDPGNDADATTSGVTLGGSYDLIHTHGSYISLPADSINCNPNLGSLADNHGPTQTIALPIGSCAVDAGPVAPPRDIANDQRGNHYPRRIGVATDIGAFEVQPLDRIFIDGFEL
ncbi:MAG: choice-of-anchor Q domain-containing protein [Rudaea sp.]